MVSEYKALVHGKHWSLVSTAGIWGDIAPESIELSQKWNRNDITSNNIPRNVALSASFVCHMPSSPQSNKEPSLSPCFPREMEQLFQLHSGVCLSSSHHLSVFMAGWSLASRAPFLSHSFLLCKKGY
jgi:hypothetical protein